MAATVSGQPSQPRPAAGAGARHLTTSSSSLDSYLQALKHRTWIGYSGELDPEIEELSIFDEPGIDLSVPAPGTGDTVSNSAPIEMVPGTHVFWSTMQGEQHGVIEEIAVTDRLLENPAEEMLVEPPHAGRGLKGGGGFTRTHAAPVRVHGRYSDPVYIILKDDGTRLGKRSHELATIRRANSSLSLGSLGSALA